MNLVTHIHHGCKHGFDQASHLASDVETLDKAAKVGYRLIDLITAIQGSMSEAIHRVSTHLKETSAFFEATRVFGGINALISPDENGNYLLTDKRNSWQKCIERICLTASSILKTIRNAVKFGFVHISGLTKHVIGHLPVFTLVADGLVIASNVCSTSESFNKLASLAKKEQRANDGIAKWENHPTTVALVRIGDEAEVKKLEGKYSAKALQFKGKLTDLQMKSRLCQDMIDKITFKKAPEVAQLSKEKCDAIVHVYKQKRARLEKDAARCENKMTTYENRIAKLAERRFDDVASELDQKDAVSKIRKWEVVKEDVEMERKPLYLKIIGSISKIAVISLALCLGFANLWTTPWLILLLSMGVFSDGTGLIRVFYERHQKNAKKAAMAAAV